MTKEQLIEALAKAIVREEVGQSDWDRQLKAWDQNRTSYLNQALAVLAELKVLGLVIVPRDPDEDMDHAGFMQMQTEHEFHASDVWRAMLAASPYGWKHV